MTCHVKYRYKPILILSIDTSSSDASIGNIDILASVSRITALEFVGLIAVCKCLEGSLVLASSPGHSQILSRSCGEKSGEGLGAKLRHGPEMVDSVSTN